jgi:hypothetical protein
MRRDTAAVEQAVHPKPVEVVSLRKSRERDEIK